MVRLALRRNSRKAGPPWLYHATGWVYLIFFYGSFTILFIKNPVQAARLGQLFQYFRIFFDAAALFLLARAVRCLLSKASKTWQKGMLIGGLLLFWLVPVFWTPGAVTPGALPEKPLLIAHRGASMLAPENTLASMQTAADLGVYGLETDITMSYDGTLFLMHDPTLARTTNIEQVFPDRANNPADRFTWRELQQLDAGQGESIPALTEMLDVFSENQLHLIYDLRIPPAAHPYAEQTLDLCLAEIKSSGAASMTWVLASHEEIPAVRATLPEAVLAAGIEYDNAPPPGDLVAEGYLLVNSESGLSNRMIHDYQVAGLWVNLWTVDEPWQYSRLWLAGADSVTSNNIQGLIALSRPVMAMTYSLYLVIWGLAGILAGVLVSSRLK